MIGRLGHYQILALIGRGGMGEVYRARDTLLDRDVALKVLPADVAGDRERLERFQREAKTVASLNHTHIVTLYSVEEAEGVRFMTMELVEGHSLDAIIGEKPMSLLAVLDISIAVADALAAAHSHGVVHRDLKPANVMLATDGRIKVLDFGLARPATRPIDVTGTSPLTVDGTVVGTVPYMSPEQVRGELVTTASDVFSFGTLLYELASGHRPFSAKYDHAIAYAIVNETPPPLSKLRRELPPALDRIVMRCHEKDPARRHSASETRDELRALRRELETGTAWRAERLRKALLVMGGVALMVIAGVVVPRWLGPDRLRESASVAHSVAVLPFVNMSADNEQEYFSDGISEELLNLLAKIPELKVAARTSSFSFKGKDVEIPEIARRLKVDHILEGSVRKTGDRVRVTAQLIQGTDGYQVWSETYDRTLDDIFAIQDEIASDVVRQLRVKLLGDVPKASVTNPEAYALYLQGREFGRRGQLATADSLLHRALEIDPGYATAWALLGANYMNQASLGSISSADGLRLARQAGARALELDPGLASAHSLLGFVELWGERDLPASARHMERALALDPANIQVLNGAAQLLASTGRLKEALLLYESMIARDPVNPAVLTNLGTLQRDAGKYEDAVATFRIALNLYPERAGVHYVLMVAFLLKGDVPAAETELEQEPDEMWRRIGFAMVYYASGRKADADASLAEVIKEDPKTFAFNIAEVFAFRGENDQAFEWLERAVEYDDSGVTNIIRSPLLNNLHADPRWIPFLRKIGMAPEQIEKIEFKVTLPPDAPQPSS
jgi:TolB-like protein/Tfp pilus assembly protein PilF